MDRIEPIRPSPPAIAPADVTRVRGVSRDLDHPDQERGRPRPREKENGSGEKGGSDETPNRQGHTAVDRYADEPRQNAEHEDGDDRPHIDVRA